MPAEAATLVWVASAPEAQAEARAALDAWARARGVRLAAPIEEKIPALPVVDWAVAERVEVEIDHAREAMATLDAERTERALAQAEAEILAHPELPQAAWLLAEIERGWGARFMRIGPVDIDRATRAWARADALDGGRAPGIGEAHPAPPRETVSATIGFEGVGEPDAPNAPAELDELEIWLDGAPVKPGVVSRAAGRHHLLVTRDDQVVWGSWITLAEKSDVRAPLTRHAACSVADMRRASLMGASIAAPGARCARWVAAVATRDPAVVRVATCERDRCAPLVEWRVGGGRVAFGPNDRTMGSRWPAWGTWTLVGVGIVTLTVVTLAAAGVFASARTETRFVNGGVRPHALRLDF